MTQVSPVQVAQEVINQGGSKPQAWAAAALVSGCESSGDSTVKNPGSDACGLFQFITSTWLGNGGGAYAPNACAAPWQDQVTVYLKASAGNNWHDWAPEDFGGNPNTPQPGSCVATHLNQLTQGQFAVGLSQLLGNVPTNWGDTTGGGVRSGLSAGPAQVQCVIQFPNLILFSGPCILTKSGVKWLSGVAAMLGGAALFSFGVVMLAAYEYSNSGAKSAVNRTTRTLGVGVPSGGGRARGGARGRGKGKGAGTSAYLAGLGPSARPAAPEPMNLNLVKAWRDLKTDKRHEELLKQEKAAGVVFGPRGGRRSATTGKPIPRPRKSKVESDYEKAAAAANARRDEDKERARRRAEGFEAVAK